MLKDTAIRSDNQRGIEGKGASRDGDVFVVSWRTGVHRQAIDAKSDIIGTLMSHG